MTIETTSEIDRALAKGAPVAIGVSGGKDSAAVAFATCAYLDNVGHTGPRILIHSDLGRVEWRDSLPTCERLAQALGLELIVVRRQAGDMMDRWLVRWDNNCRRYRDLSCVKLILPWSTPAMRFCTSELKTAVICRALVQRFPGQTILSVSGIRAQESRQRAKAPIAQPQPKLTHVGLNTAGYDWHPILHWTVDDVWSLLAARGFRAHEAYTRYGASRVSCAFCIMSAEADLAAAATCADNHAVYREMVGLEVRSTFSFHEHGWLGDVAPHLLDSATRAAFAQAKVAAGHRAAAEARIPAHLLYTKGWPTVMPSPNEAALLADTRATVGQLVGLAVQYTTADDIVARYAELMAARPRILAA